MAHSKGMMAAVNFCHGRRCVTEKRFQQRLELPPHDGIQPEAVLDVVHGRIPLWERDTTLRWRFEEASLRRHANAWKVKRRVRRLLQDAIDEWESAAPVKFVEQQSAWDFEIAVLKRRDCDDEGCTLASAFFPSHSRERMLILPTIFEYDEAEQVSTMVHELGHVFGLRHSFAKEEEPSDPSIPFGSQSEFTVMNYGSKSRLTQADRRDLTRLYAAAWSGEAEAKLGLPVCLYKAPHLVRWPQEEP